MSQFKKPVKELLINTADQLKVTAGDGTAILGTSTTFSLAGLLEQAKKVAAAVIAGGDKLEAGIEHIVTGSAKKTLPAEAVKEVVDIQVGGLLNGAQAGDLINVQVVYKEITGEIVEYHNQPLRRMYQVKAGTATEVRDRIKAAIDADEFSPATATKPVGNWDNDATTADTESADRVRLSADAANISISVYAEKVSLTKHVITAAKEGILTYEQLKNKFYSKVLQPGDFDRSENRLPRKGEKYVKYSFTAFSDQSNLGGHVVADEGHGRKSKSEFAVYVNQNLADLLADLDNFRTAVNA